MARLADIAEKHQNWRSPLPSFFISAFDDFNHARFWGLQRRGPVYMYTIDTYKLPLNGQWVFWLEKGNEYLFVDKIPGDAIVAEQEMKPAEPARKFTIIHRLSLYPSVPHDDSACL